MRSKKNIIIQYMIWSSEAVVLVMVTPADALQSPDKRLYLIWFTAVVNALITQKVSIVNNVKIFIKTFRGSQRSEDNLLPAKSVIAIITRLDVISILQSMRRLVKKVEEYVMNVSTTQWEEIANNANLISIAIRADVLKIIMFVNPVIVILEDLSTTPLVMNTRTSVQA